MPNEKVVHALGIPKIEKPDQKRSIASAAKYSQSAKSLNTYQEKSMIDSSVHSSKEYLKSRVRLDDD